MNKVYFYNSLMNDLNVLLNRTKSVVSNEGFVYVNQKVNRILYLIQIQIQEIQACESR